MNDGDRLHQALDQYFALQQHHADADFLARLQHLQQWQTQRLFKTHQPVLDQLQAHDAADFLFYEVYGGAHLYAVAKDIKRAVNKALAFFPKKVMHTAAITLEAAVLTQQLDESLCRALIDDNITVESYAAAYRTSCTTEQRQQQLELILAASELIDRYVRKRLLLASFRMMRRPAHAAKFGNLYDFLDHGFTALGDITSVTPLVKQLTTVENIISQRLFSAHPSPFSGVTHDG